MMRTKVRAPSFSPACAGVGCKCLRSLQFVLDAGAGGYFECFEELTKIL
jgi:hypothetical protein